ncbi:MAG: hypothetical protein AAF805_03570, partial [Planctomycetota bacterium]
AAAGELPRDFNDPMKEALDGGSLFEFRDQKLQRLRNGRAQEASAVLTGHKWIEVAHVTFNEQRETGLRGRRTASAAVSIQPAVGESLTKLRLRSVKQYVSRSLVVPTENIAVTNLGDDLMAESGAGGEVDPEEFENPFYRTKARFERDLRGKILEQVSYIPGVRVQVNAQLEETSQKRTTTVKPEGEAVQIKAVTVEEKKNQSSGPPGARVGQVANEARGPASVGRDDALAREDQSTSSRDEADKEYLSGSSKTDTVVGGHVPEEAFASIAIPRDYVLTVYRQENADENGDPPAEIDAQALAQLETRIKGEVERLAEKLVPRLAAGRDEFKQVVVEFFSPPPRPEIPPPSATAGALAMASDYAGPLAMTGLAVFSLLMLRSIVSSSGDSEPTGGLPSLQLDGETLAAAPGGGGAEDEDGERPRLKLKKADTVKDDLTDMVSSDPDAAAAILRNWINNAAG